MQISKLELPVLQPPLYIAHLDAKNFKWLEQSFNIKISQQNFAKNVFLGFKNFWQDLHYKFQEKKF